LFWNSHETAKIRKCSFETFKKMLIIVHYVFNVRLFLGHVLQ
jgi:hypothetical protein